MMVGWFAKDLQLEYAKVLHERLLVQVLSMAMKQCYGKRRRDLELGLYRFVPQRFVGYKEYR